MRKSVGGGDAHRLENAFVVFVRHAIPEWKVQSIVFALSNTNILNQISSDSFTACDLIAHSQLSCPWKELSILVKTNRHHPVRSIERFLNAVTVVHVDVNI